MSQHNLEINENGLLINGVRTQILSGAIHYFRMFPEQWADRIRKAAALGLNAVETYIPWNMHEAMEGHFDFSGMLDLEKFLDLIAENDLYAIVRPGPFICAEWSNGGLPVWLTLKKNCRVRRDDPVWLEAIKRWFDVLLPKLASRQYTRGGNIILCAAENEYGHYCRDKAYLAKILRFFSDHGFDIPLISADFGGSQSTTYGGMMDGCAATLTMGADRTLECFDLHRTIRPHDPDWCMEYWAGNYDWWGEPHTVIPCGKAVREYERMVARGASVNIYMLYGGTNFGFNNGANHVLGGYADGHHYAPQTTSYDYNALLDETGDPTEKYFLFRDVIRKYHPETPESSVTCTPKASYGTFPCSACAPLFENLEVLSQAHHCDDPHPMEDFGCYGGFILYRTHLDGPTGNVFPNRLRLFELRDRAQIFLDGKFLGDLMRPNEINGLPLRIDKTSAQLDVLVENLGYTNFGPMVGRESKGVTGILVDNQFQDDIECRPLPLNDLSRLQFKPGKEVAENTPCFYRFCFEIEKPQDTFLKFPGIKGCVWVNHFNIGRYWNIGPGDALYVPGPALKKGLNEVIVFELYHLNKPSITFSNERNWGPGRDR